MVTAFISGLLIGGLVGVAVMALLQIGREQKK